MPILGGCIGFLRDFSLNVKVSDCVCGDSVMSSSGTTRCNVPIGCSPASSPGLLLSGNSSFTALRAGEQPIGTLHLARFSHVIRSDICARAALPIYLLSCVQGHTECFCLRMLADSAKGRQRRFLWVYHIVAATTAWMDFGAISVLPVGVWASLAMMPPPRTRTAGMPVQGQRDARGQASRLRRPARNGKSGMWRGCPPNACGARLHCGHNSSCTSRCWSAQAGTKTGK